MADQRRDHDSEHLGGKPVPDQARRTQRMALAILNARGPGGGRGGCTYSMMICD